MSRFPSGLIYRALDDIIFLLASLGHAMRLIAALPESVNTAAKVGLRRLILLVAWSKRGQSFSRGRIIFASNTTPSSMSCECAAS